MTKKMIGFILMFAMTACTTESEAPVVEKDHMAGAYTLTWQYKAGLPQFPPQAIDYDLLVIANRRAEFANFVCQECQEIDIVAAEDVPGITTIYGYSRDPVFVFEYDETAEQETWKADLTWDTAPFAGANWIATATLIQ